jgi:predicted Zn-dependent protease
MKKYLRLFILFQFILFTSLNVQAQEKTNIKYDFSCFNKDAASTFTNTMGKMGSLIWDIAQEDLTAKKEEEYGDKFLESARKQFKFIEYGADISRLQNLLRKLNSNISNPRGFNYKIYLIDTSMLNAFTFGGKIFVTTEMLSFCNNNDELACIIGHEIAHNELGHISESIKKNNLLNEYLGQDLGDVFFSLSRVVFAPFSQIDEAHSDMRGMDIAVASGYDICQNKKLWDRMSKKEGEYNSLSNLLSSHPYSGTRRDCAEQHIKNNYNLRCSN